MRADKQLDISEVVVPISLALCKSTLGRMAEGAVLEIRLRDRDTLRDLLLILERTGEQILAWENQEDYYRVWVRKSP